MEWEGVFGLLVPFLNRKTTCRLRAVSRASRSAVPKPKPFKRVNTTSVAKVKMILNLGKTIGYLEKEKYGPFKFITVNYRDTCFDFFKMKTFPWFEKSSLAKLFFLAHKFREYDSKLIKLNRSLDWRYTLTPPRARQILEQKSSEDCVSPTFLNSIYNARS